MRIYAGTRRNHRATKSGKFPPENPPRLSRSGFTAHAPTPSLITRTVTSRRLTPRRVQPQQQQAPFRLPEKAASKDAPAVVSRRERNNPHPIPFRQRNWAPSLLRSRGFDSCPRATESGATTGEPMRGRGPSKRNAWDALCRVRDRQGGLRMGSHRREAPSHRGPANGLSTH